LGFRLSFDIAHNGIVNGNTQGWRGEFIRMVCQLFAVWRQQDTMLTTTI